MPTVYNYFLSKIIIYKNILIIKLYTRSNLKTTLNTCIDLLRVHSIFKVELIVKAIY